jgi:hypothetical protein
MVDGNQTNPAFGKQKGHLMGRPCSAGEPGDGTWPAETLTSFGPDIEQTSSETGFSPREAESAWEMKGASDAIRTAQHASHAAILPVDRFNLIIISISLRKLRVSTQPHLMHGTDIEKFCRLT